MMTHVMSQRYAGLSIKSPPLAEKCGLVSAMMSLSHLPAYSKFSRTAAKWIRAKSTGNHKIKTNLQDVAKDYIHSFPEYANALDSDWKNSLPLKRTMVRNCSPYGRSACPCPQFRRFRRLWMGLLRLIMHLGEPAFLSRTLHFTVDRDLPTYLAR
jgi:hypothetical protein